MTEVDSQVEQILRNFGSRERFLGVVDSYDLAGTTAYIRSHDQFYLVFASELKGLRPGQLVSYRRDQLRARDNTRSNRRSRMARNTADKFKKYEQLKADAHAKVETLTPTQLRKFLAAYKNPGGWNKQESEPQIAAKEQTQ